MNKNIEVKQNLFTETYSETLLQLSLVCDVIHVYLTQIDILNEIYCQRSDRNCLRVILTSATSFYFNNKRYFNEFIVTRSNNMKINC